jgi:uncharacterized membrane protein YkoI
MRVSVVLMMVMALVFAAGVCFTGVLMNMEAKHIALEKAGVKAAEATFTKERLDYEGGMPEYEFAFVADGTEYDVDVDANTGRVVDFKVVN